jgi:hypothetical protein
MKNIFKKLFLLTLLAGAITSCDMGDDKELNYGNEAFVAQFPFAAKSGFFLKSNSEIFSYEVPVELVGGNGLALDTDVAVSFEKLAYVDDASTTNDDTYVTAVEGTDFEFVNPVNSLVIPAGSTFASIPIRVISGNLDDTHPAVIVLSLTEVTATGATVVSSGNKGKINLILQATCTSDLAGMYDLTATRISTGAIYPLPGEEITEIGTGQYLTSSTGPYNIRGLISAGAQLGTPSGGFVFNEVCGRIALTQPDQGLGNGAYSNIVTQSPAQAALSVVNPVTGVITIYYSIWFTGNTVERPYFGVYTPL